MSLMTVGTLHEQYCGVER